MQAIKRISEELNDYLSREVELSENVRYSEYRVKRRIAQFESKSYPTGKFDKQKKYKYWFEITDQSIGDEVKNIDFDTKDVKVESDQRGYEVCDLIVNIKLSRWLRDNGQAKELNDSVYEFSSWGNVLFEKGKDGYTRADLKNTFVINTTAKTIDETPLIQRYLFTQSELRGKEGWKNVEKAIETCGNKFFSKNIRTTEEKTSVPYYEVMKRDGEVTVAELKEANDKKPNEGDEKKYVLARIVVTGLDNGEGGGGVVLFAEEYPKGKKLSDYFVEGHRGEYRGRWLREGLREALFECQTRANEIGNQIARGLEYASKKIITAKDRSSVQNVMTGLRNGDILRGEFGTLDLRMDGFDQLFADWNRNIQLRNEIANSREVVQGANPPSGQPFRTTGLMNQNANKLFVFLREQLAIPLNVIFEKWLIPELVKDIKAEDYAKLTGKSEYYMKFIDLVVKGWYIRNLTKIGPHNPEMGLMLQEGAREELLKQPELLAKLTREKWNGYKPTVVVDMAGELLTLQDDLNQAYQFVGLIADPITRDAYVGEVMKKAVKWIDVDSLPKTPPQAPLNQSGMLPRNDQRREVEAAQ